MLPSREDAFYTNPDLTGAAVHGNLSNNPMKEDRLHLWLCEARALIVRIRDELEKENHCGRVARKDRVELELEALQRDRTSLEEEIARLSRSCSEGEP